MAGQLIPRGKDTYLLRVFVGRDAQGKRTYVSEVFHGGKRKAEERLADLVSDKGKGKLAPKPKGTVAEFLDTWLETTAKPSVRDRTYHDYVRCLDYYVRPHIGALKLSKLAPADVRRMLAKLTEEGYAPRTVRQAHEVLRNALEQAVSDRLIRDNPARSRLVKKALPPRVKHEPSTVPADSVTDLLEVARGERLGAFFLLSLFSGLRPSEALALRWSDINGNTISVTRVLVDRIGELRYAPPKSKTSRRAVVVPDVVVEVLKGHRKRQLEERLKAGEEWKDTEGLMFVTPTGERIRQHTLRAPWKAIKRAAGLPADIKLYGLQALGSDPAVGARGGAQGRVGDAGPQQREPHRGHVQPRQCLNAAAGRRRARGVGEVRISLPPGYWKERRKWSVERWEGLRRRCEDGHRPPDEDLAMLVRFHGTPTPWSQEYVADRLRGNHTRPGRSVLSEQEHLARIRRAVRLHEAVEERAAALRLQGVPRPKTMALDIVRRLTGRREDLAVFVRRQIREPLQRGGGGWKVASPLVSAEEAKARVLTAIEAGVITLDPVLGWRLTEGSKKHP